MKNLKLLASAYATVLAINMITYKIIDSEMERRSRELWKTNPATADEFYHHVYLPFRENKISLLNPLYALSAVKQLEKKE